MGRPFTLVMTLVRHICTEYSPSALSWSDVLLSHQLNCKTRRMCRHTIQPDIHLLRHKHIQPISFPLSGEAGLRAVSVTGHSATYRHRYQRMQCFFLSVRRMSLRMISLPRTRASWSLPDTNSRTRQTVVRSAGRNTSHRDSDRLDKFSTDRRPLPSSVDGLSCDSCDGSFPCCSTISAIIFLLSERTIFS